MRDGPRAQSKTRSPHCSVLASASSSPGRFARLRALGSDGGVAPKIQALREATYFTGLRKAGMPEE
jgi:hypothetical protein